MVIHDKVYDTSSFVDEHPYVSIPLLSRLPIRRRIIASAIHLHPTQTPLLQQVSQEPDETGPPIKDRQETNSQQ